MNTHAPYSLAISLAFSGHLVNVLLLEPGLGFAGPEDFFSFGKMLPVLSSWIWALGALWHLVVAIALVGVSVNGVSSGKTRVKLWGSAFALLGAFCFLLVCMINLAGFAELGQIHLIDRDGARSGYYGMLGIRASLLSAGVFSMGVALVVPASVGVISRADNMALNTCQIVVGLTCITFVVVPDVIPVMMVSLIVWGLWSGIAGLRN